jgi:cytochrome c
MRHAFLITALLGLVACDGGNGASSTGSNDGAAVPRFADYDAGRVPGGPGAGKRFEIGTTADPAMLAAMDRDVGPDGAELPAGKGTVAEGGALFAAQCAMCHGAKGEGMEPAFPRLLGRVPAAEGFAFSRDPKLPHTIGNYWSHATTLFDYIRRAMPHTAPGSLTDDQVYALTAYLLAMDDVIAKDATLDAAMLRTVRMPYADRFVPDDRKPGAPQKYDVK